jgi:hypothetical protein
VGFSLAALLAAGAVIAALIALFVTSLETDSGWGDALWTDSPWPGLAWAATALLALGAAGSVHSARPARLSSPGGGRRFALWIGLSGIAGLGWLALAFLAAS